MQCGTAPLNRMHCRTVYAYLQYLTYTIQYKLSVAYKRNDRPSSLLRRSPCRSRPSYAHCRYTTCRRRWFFDLLCARFRNSYELHTSFDRLLVCSCLIVEPALPQLAIEVQSVEIWYAGRYLQVPGIHIKFVRQGAYWGISSPHFSVWFPCSSPKLIELES